MIHPSRILMILAMAALVMGCNSTPEKPKEKPKKPVGELCKSTLEPGKEKMSAALEKKDFSQIQIVFTQYDKAGQEMATKYIPKMEKENLDLYLKQAKEFREDAAKGLKAAKAKDLEQTKKSYRKVKQHCMRCHFAYRK